MVLCDAVHLVQRVCLIQEVGGEGGGLHLVQRVCLIQEHVEAYILQTHICYIQCCSICSADPCMFNIFISHLRNTHFARTRHQHNLIQQPLARVCTPHAPAHPCTPHLVGHCCACLQHQGVLAIRALSQHSCKVFQRA